MQNINANDIVINPDVTERSPNRLGTVESVYPLMVEGKEMWFAWVKFRDYEGGFSLGILKKI